MNYTFSQGCPLSGAISLQQVAEEMQVSLSEVSLQALSLQPLNPNTQVKPNGYVPHGIDEFRGYQHRSVGLSKDEFSFEHYASGDHVSFAVWPSATVGLKVNSDWIQADNVGGGSVYISVVENPISSSRHGIVEVSANGVKAFITVSQAGNPHGGVEM